MAVQGTWNVLGYNLPDFGLTEQFSSKGSSLYNPKVTAAAPSVGSNVGGGGNYAPTTPSYTPAAPTASKMGSGSVLGTSSGGYSNTGYSQSQQPQQFQDTGSQQTSLINDYASKQQGLINSQFDQYRGYLNNLIGELPNQQEQLNQQVGNEYNSQLTDITSGQTNALTDTQRAREQTVANKASSFKDLEENLRNSLFGANQYLGVLGASNSSGANRYATALTKANNKQRAGINKDANSALADISTREEKIKTTAQAETQKLNNWKSNQMLQVSQYINDKKSELQQMIANGDIDRSSALRELNASIFPAAMQRLQQIDADVKGYRNSILQFAMDNLSSINQYKSNLGQLSAVNAPEYVAQQLNYLPQYSQQAGNALTGIAPGLFKKEDQQFNLVR